MADAPFVLEERDGPVVILSFNRPERHNAVNYELNEQFLEKLVKLTADVTIRAVVIRGEGKSLSSGRDTGAGAHWGDVTHLELIESGHKRTQLMLSAPFPFIAAMKGWTLGVSLERALLCDMRIADETLKISLPEV